MHEGLRERLENEGDKLMFQISNAREERNALTGGIRLN